MRHIIALTITLPLLALALPACDFPDTEAEMQALDLEEDIEVQTPQDRVESRSEAEAAEAFVLDEELTLNPSVERKGPGSPQAGTCYCYTTCSSNGRGWTKTFYTGTSGNGGTGCNNKAHNYCENKSPSYDWANSACGSHP